MSYCNSVYDDIVVVIFCFYICHLLYQLSLTHAYKIKLVLKLMNFITRYPKIQIVLNTAIILPLGFATI